MKIDLHVHTTTSPCSVFSPRVLVESARGKGLPVVATTNHHDSCGDATYLEKELGTSGILHISGLEMTTRWGDFLLFGENLGEFQGIRTDFPTDLLPRPDVAVIWAHPARFLNDREIDSLKNLVSPYIDAVEVLNGNCVLKNREANTRAARIAMELGKPSTAGSDSHSPGMFMMTWTEFAEPVLSYRDLVRCIKEGKVCVTPEAFRSAEEKASRLGFAVKFLFALTHRITKHLRRIRMTYYLVKKGIFRIIRNSNNRS